MGSGTAAHSWDSVTGERMGLHGVTSVKENRTCSAQEQRLGVSQAAAGHKPSAAASFPGKARRKRRALGAPGHPVGRRTGNRNGGGCGAAGCSCSGSCAWGGGPGHPLGPAAGPASRVAAANDRRSTRLAVPAHVSRRGGVSLPSDARLCPFKRGGGRGAPMVPRGGRRGF